MAHIDFIVKDRENSIIATVQTKIQAFAYKVEGNKVTEKCSGKTKIRWHCVCYSSTDRELYWRPV